MLAPTILHDTGLTIQQYGWIVSAFSIAYSLANPIWGRILDRAGLRRGMTVAVSCWTLASVAHAFAGGFWSFAAARAALGFGEGATFPGGLRTVVQTLPQKRRGRGLAVAYSGGSLGAMVTPLVVTPIFLWFGWRGAFWFTGLVGLAWLALWAVPSAAAPTSARSHPPTAHATPGPRMGRPPPLGLPVRVRARRTAARFRALHGGALPGASARMLAKVHRPGAVDPAPGMGGGLLLLGLALRPRSLSPRIAPPADGLGARYSTSPSSPCPW